MGPRTPNTGVKSTNQDNTCSCPLIQRTNRCVPSGHSFTAVCSVAPLSISGSCVGPPFGNDSVTPSRIQGLLWNYMAECLASPQTFSLHFWAAIAPALTSFSSPEPAVEEGPGRMVLAGLQFSVPLGMLQGFLPSCAGFPPGSWHPG